MNNIGEGGPKEAQTPREFPEEMPEVKVDLTGAQTFEELYGLVKSIGGIKGYSWKDLVGQFSEAKAEAIPSIYRKLLLGNEVDMDEELKMLTRGEDKSEGDNLRAAFQRLLEAQISKSTEVIAKNIKNFEDLRRIFAAMGLEDADLLADQIERNYSGYVGQLRREIKEGRTDLAIVKEGAKKDFNTIYPNLGIGDFLSRIFGEEIDGASS